MSGRLAIVLHTHMPYVEGFGTWPFGEEWLWEAIATSYLPLLDVLDERPGRVTLSLTPVLADQLAAPGVAERFAAFMHEIRPESHRLDVEAHPEVAPQLDRSAARYRTAAEHFEARGRDLVAAFAPHVRWTSAATHPVLPLLATDAGIRLQLETGIASHRARFGDWDGGLWLPECAHAPWLDERLAEAGVRVACVDLTDHGVDPLTPLRTPDGPVLAPIDRSIVDLVWSPAGYPSAGPYLDTHAHTTRRHLAWSVDGRPYDAERARAQLRAHADDFAERVAARVARGGLSVCALDTELLGHWWPEGVFWLAQAIDACEARGVPIVPLGDAVGDAVALTSALPVTSWGEPRTLATWSAPSAGGLAWRQRAAELEVLAAGGRAGERALRELLALQSSDWAFLVSRGTAGPYPLVAVGAGGSGRRAGAAQPGPPAGGPRADPRLRAFRPAAPYASRLREDTPSPRRPRRRGAGDPTGPAGRPVPGANRRHVHGVAQVQREPVSSPRRRRTEGVRSDRRPGRHGRVRPRRARALAAVPRPRAPARDCSQRSGAAVAHLQRALGIPADGVFGRQTRRAVRIFQRKRGLAVDGIAGPVTLAALGLRSTPAAPAPAGDRSGILARIAACESGGNPRAVSPDGRYRGKYQFSRATWRGVGGTGDPAKAPEAEQDRRAAALLAREGTRPWPHCGRRAR